MTEHPVSAEDKQRTAALLNDLWQRNLPLLEQRMAVLERATCSPLTEELRAEASKLAGSLGMFGYKQGTEIARELELELESTSPDISRTACLTAQLRSVLFPES